MRTFGMITVMILAVATAAPALAAKKVYNHKNQGSVCYEKGCKGDHCIVCTR